MGSIGRANDRESDDELIARYRSGEVEALGSLVNRYRRLLYGVVLNMVGGRDDADEIVQEVWFRVIRKAGSFGRKNFRVWLLRIARNLVIDRYRRKRAVVSLDEEREEGGTLADAIADGGPDAARRMEIKDVNSRIQRAVSMLPDEQREVFLMRVRSDLSFKEIAKVQKVSINTVLARMHYAVGKLRTSLGGSAGEDPVMGDES